MNETLVIAERIPYLDREELRSALETRLRSLSSGLDVSAKFEGLTDNGFVRIGLRGSDSEVFGELIKRKLGLAPWDLSEIQVYDNFKAYTVKPEMRRQSIRVEIGPVSMYLKSEIAREGLIAQLCDGRNVPVDTIARTYCIQENVPIGIRITSIDPDRKEIEAWISDDQVTRFEEWRQQRFHRIIAVGGFQDAIREAIRLSRVERDIIDVEELALTVHSLVCKIGTDAAGIIAKVGRYVGNFELYAFLPERVDKLRFGITEPR